MLLRIYYCRACGAASVSRGNWACECGQSVFELADNDRGVRVFGSGSLLVVREGMLRSNVLTVRPEYRFEGTAYPSFETIPGSCVEEVFSQEVRRLALLTRNAAWLVQWRFSRLYSRCRKDQEPVTGVSGIPETVCS